MSVNHGRTQPSSSSVCSSSLCIQISNIDICDMACGGGGTFIQQVAYPDVGPVMLLSEASVKDLSSRLEKDVTADRFRPNIVISGCEAFEEVWAPALHLLTPLWLLLVSGTKIKPEMLGSEPRHVWFPPPVRNPFSSLRLTNTSPFSLWAAASAQFISDCQKNFQHQLLCFL